MPTPVAVQNLLQPSTFLQLSRPLFCRSQSEHDLWDARVVLDPSLPLTVSGAACHHHNTRCDHVFLSVSPSGTCLCPLSPRRLSQGLFRLSVQGTQVCVSGRVTGASHHQGPDSDHRIFQNPLHCLVRETPRHGNSEFSHTEVTRPSVSLRSQDICAVIVPPPPNNQAS